MPVFFRTFLLVLCISPALFCHSAFATNKTGSSVPASDIAPNHIIQHIQDNKHINTLSQIGPNTRISVLSFESHDHLSIEEIMNTPINNYHKIRSDWGVYFFSDKYVWHRVELVNDSDKELVRVLSINQRAKEFYHLYTTEKNSILGTISSGHSVPYEEREYESVNFLHNIILKPKQRMVIFLDFELIKTPYPGFYLKTIKEAFQENTYELTFIMFVFGTMFCFATYHLILYFVVREPVYLAFTFAIASCFCLIFVEAGFTSRIIPGISSHLRHNLLTITSLLFAFSCILYTKIHLNITKKDRFEYSALVFGVGVAIICLIFAVILENFYTQTYYPKIIGSVLLLGTIAISISVVVPIFTRLKQGSRAAKMLVIGAIPVLLASSYHTWMMLSGLEISAGVKPTIILLIIFGAFMSVVTADHIKRLMKEKQQESAKTLSAEAETKAKSQFLAQMSHEIRTPMNGVLGMSELLADTGLSTHQQHYLDVIKGSGEALLNVINDILDYSKIEAGKLDIEHLPYDLEQLISDAVSIFSLNASKKNIALIASVKPETPSQVVGDSLRIRQILLNLLSNAFKFTANGHVTLRVEVTDGENPEDQYLKFEIKDSGVGISEENQKKLFQSFNQAESSTARRFGGTGLGLAISKSLSELMGGNVGIESKEGEGSTFWFTVKLDRATEQQKLEIPSSLLDNKELDQQLKGKRVLIVDDNALYVEYLKEQIDSWGMVCECSYDAKGALEKIKNDSLGFDVISLDYEMPGMDGLQCAEAIRALRGYSTCPILLLTALRADINSEEIKKSGIQEVMGKPSYAGMMKSTYARLLNIVIDKKQEKEKEATPQFNLSVLVAEDNNVNQMVIKGLLKKLGISALIKENGLQAYEYYQSNHAQIDCILMDCEMPEMNGYESTQCIRAFEKENGLEQTKIFALSAHAMNESIQQSLDAGMNGHIVKPIKIEFIVKAFNEVLEASGAKEHTIEKPNHAG